MLKIGTSSVNKIFIGSDEINKAYLGNTLVYSSGPAPHDYSKDYLTFDILTGGTIIWMKKKNLSPSVTISYSINNGNWVDITSNTGSSAPTISVNEGDKVRIKGNNNAYCATATTTGTTTKDYYNSFSGDTSARYNVYGNIMSLIYGDNFIGNNEFPDTNGWSFKSLFEGSKNVVSAKNLILPPTTLYMSSFRALFSNATNLVEGPELLAPTLAPACYSYIFGTTKITYVKCLATDISAAGCLYNWLTSVPSSGTFVKKAGVTYPSGASGIPRGWTVEYDEQITSITLTNLTWVTDVPKSGGTADSGNCSFNVYAYYSSGTVVDITSEAIISGSLSVSATTATTREMVGTLTLTASYSGFTDSDTVDVYQMANSSSYVWVDIRTVNNTTPLYDIGWKTNGSFSGDKWFAELRGLTTDSSSWTGGKTASSGRYTYHRFNANSYTCNFLPQYDSLGDGYGVGGIEMGYSQDYGYGARDTARNTLPTETINGNTYYVLGLENWLDWKPLYVPYSVSKIQSNWSAGLIMVKILA